MVMQSYQEEGKHLQKEAGDMIAQNMDNRIVTRALEKSLNIDIMLSIPIGYRIIRSVYDISERGLSFYMQKGEGCFEEHCILKNVRIFNREYESIIGKSKVAYCKLYTTEREEQYKIGLEFLTHEMTQKKRSRRFHNVRINNVATKISFELDGETHRAQLLDFSKYGLSISIKQPHFILKKSDVLKNINITIDEVLVYSGDGVIVSVNHINGNMELRISLKNGFIPIDDILFHSDKTKTECVLANLRNDIFIGNLVSKEFKENVHELRYILENVKSTLNDFENKVQEEDVSSKTELTQAMFNALARDMFPKLDKVLIDLDMITQGLTRAMYETYGRYYKQNIHPLILSVPFVYRVYTKPLGYAGDYEMMNMIYRNAYEGKTLFEQFMNKYSVSIIPAQTNRNRIDYLVKTLHKKVQEYRNVSTRIRITDVACGPCIELQKFIEEDELSNYCDFTLVDISQEALDHARDRLESLKKRYQRQTGLSFVQESVYTLIKKKKNRACIADNQHLIYSSGLFEYLSDVPTKRLIKILFDKLAQHGLLIIGNYSWHGHFRSHMELGGDWYLIYRSREELLALANSIEREKHLHVDDDGKIEFNTFLTIERLS